ncbi:Hypothetical protein D9617_13g100280 [Elsinoe fawcettii]|nr:Hypothetical protein D9617_13g100280 [Elsinoe fawcettii]
MKAKTLWQRLTPSIHPTMWRSLPVKRKRGRPRKFVPDPSTPPQSKLDQAPTPHSISSTSHGLPIDDFELLHHYSLHTAPTLTLTPNSPSSWAQKAITLSFASSKHWLIHFPLALSAFHLSRLRPDESSKFFAQGEVHLKLGLAEVAEVVKDLNESNAREVFLATMVLCFATWARGPEEGDLMLISERGEAVWWTMLRGLQAVLLKVGGSGVFADVFDDAEEDEKRVAEKDASRRVEIRWEDEFDAVKSKVLKDDDHSAGPVISALEAMRPAYEATFGTKEEPKMREAVFQVVFGWLFRIGDDFMALLTGRDEAALIVLAHFVVLMNRLPPCWFLEGWVEHILDGIKKCLSDHWKAELAWIEDTLEW